MKVVYYTVKTKFQNINFETFREAFHFFRYYSCAAKAQLTKTVVTTNNIHSELICTV